MTDIYAAAYIVPTERRPPDCAPCPTAARFYDRVRSSGFPYDVGDDPAFFSASHHGGPVTWGVCRPDLRGLIKPGDWMIFFSAEHPNGQGDVTHYRFVAALDVERKISQLDVFQCPPNFAFQNYLNLLIRPAGTGWEHFEPGLHPKDWYRDWLWRLCERRGLRKAPVEAQGQSHRGGDPLPYEMANNYVVFSREASFIASNPPLVATHRKEDMREEWASDPCAQRIHEVLLQNNPRGLRTSNRQQPHRHLRLEPTDPNWLALLREAVEGANNPQA